MPLETMTPCERWLAVLRREKPDRVPMGYRITQEAEDKLIRHLGVADRREALQRLHIDALFIPEPRYVGPSLPADESVFGVKYRDVSYGPGSYREAISHPLEGYGSVEEIEANYRWPSPDWWDYTDLPQQVAAWPGYPVQGGGSEPFLIYKNLRGDAQAYLDLVVNPEIVHYCLDKLFELAYQDTLRTFEAIPGQVLITRVNEDMGSQEGLLFSPAHIREFLIPRMKRMIDLVHEGGAYAFHHSDGAIRKILPDMIAAGIDVLDPLQWRCPGMEREGLKRDFGHQVILHGGVDNQYTLAFGSVGEVRQEVVDNLRILGQGGGYILCSCHRIQVISPAENMVAMYETGYEYGWT